MLSARFSHCTEFNFDCHHYSEFCYAECHYDECSYVEGIYVESVYAERRYTEYIRLCVFMLSVVILSELCRVFGYAECLHASMLIVLVSLVSI